MTPHLLIILLLLASAAAYFLSRWLTGEARRWALRHNVVSPVTPRSSHSRPTARLGGVGLALGFASASAVILLALRPTASHPGAISLLDLHHLLRRTLGWLLMPGAIPALDAYRLFWLALGWLLMFVVGLLDDLYDLPALLKLAPMTLAALAPALGGGLVFHAWARRASWPPAAGVAINVGFTIFWFLFFTNGYNFMDGMDGFAADFARVAASFLFILFWLGGMRHGGLHAMAAEACLLPLLAAACCGFLRWNNPPAKVFMGDGGSLSVGYVLAASVVLGTMPSGGMGSSRPALSALTVLLPFIFDVTLTLLRRARMGQNLLAAHREHLYQRLLRCGWTHAKVLRLNRLFFWLCGLAALAGAWTHRVTGPWIGAGVALALVFVYWGAVLYWESPKVRMSESPRSKS